MNSWFWAVLGSAWMGSATKCGCTTCTARPTEASSGVSSVATRSTTTTTEVLRRRQRRRQRRRRPHLRLHPLRLRLLHYHHRLLLLLLPLLHPRDRQRTASSLN